MADFFRVEGGARSIGLPSCIRLAHPIIHSANHGPIDRRNSPSAPPQTLYNNKPIPQNTTTKHQLCRVIRQNLGEQLGSVAETAVAVAASPASVAAALAPSVWSAAAGGRGGALSSSPLIPPSAAALGPPPGLTLESEGGGGEEPAAAAATAAVAGEGEGGGLSEETAGGGGEQSSAGYRFMLEAVLPAVQRLLGDSQEEVRA